MVKSVIGEVTTYYVNAGYEKKVQGDDQVVRKYYSAGGTRIAMRENEVLTWLLSDHLGSTSVTADAAGNLVSSVKYTAFGEVRSGTSSTDYNYTGQRNETEIGLDYYVARFYDPMLGRFVQADTIIPEPGSSKGFDRYSYVNNNPVNFNDPSGHCYNMVNGQLSDRCQSYWKQVTQYYSVVKTSDYESLSTKDLRQPKVNDCGPWAVSREDPDVSNDFEDFIVSREGYENVFDYGGGGLSPEELDNFSNQFFSSTYHVEQKEHVSITDMYSAIYNDETVVVDILVSGTAPNFIVGNDVQNIERFAHFARVVKVDLANNSITLVNSINTGNGGTWDISWEDYLSAADNPEMYSSNNQYVQNWMLTIRPK